MRFTRLSAVTALCILGLTQFASAADRIAALASPSPKAGLT